MDRDTRRHGQPTTDDRQTQLGVFVDRRSSLPSESKVHHALFQLLDSLPFLLLLLIHETTQVPLQVGI